MITGDMYGNVRGDNEGRIRGKKGKGNKIRSYRKQEQWSAREVRVARAPAAAFGREIQSYSKEDQGMKASLKFGALEAAPVSSWWTSGKGVCVICCRGSRAGK